MIGKICTLLGLILYIGDNTLKNGEVFKSLPVTAPT